MENTNRSAGEELAAKLLEEPKNAGLIMNDEEIAAADGFCEDYKTFLNAAKTEREACAEAIKRAKAAGFTEYDPAADYKAGDKFYFCASAITGTELYPGI